MQALKLDLHIIEKLILGDKAAVLTDTSKNYTPGDQFKNIAILHNLLCFLV